MASVREWINSIQHDLPNGSTCPIDGIIIFPPINANWVLHPHEDALILTLGINGFDVRRVLIDPGSLANICKMSANRKMGLPPSYLENPGRVQSGFNGAITTSLGEVVLPV